DDDGETWEGQQERSAKLNTGVAGVHSVLAFQCETCWIRNLEGRDPDPIADRNYVVCLRQANLDAMNSRASNTMKSHVDHILATDAGCKELNCTPDFPQRGPFPLADLVGMGCAVDMLYRSLTTKGRVNDHIQFGTMRKGRSTQTRLWASSPTGTLEGSTFSGNASRIRFTTCPTQSEWFSTFLLGAQDRMGYETRNQKAVTISAIVRQIELIEEDIADADTQEHAHFLVKVATLITILSVASLRGHEGFYLDIAATRRHFNEGKDGVVPARALTNRLMTEKEVRDLPRVCICLLGKFKGETDDSGLRPRFWIGKLLQVCEDEGRSNGYAFNNPDGSCESPTEYNAVVRQYFTSVRDEDEGLIDVDADVIRFGVSRTYRKSSESRARAAGIPKDQVETMNWWRKIERAKGKMPQFDMADHYADAKQLSTLTWRYSYAL
ncbi:hypothetical protein ACHAWO_011011, partial [Cyclotella atomus]